MDVTALLGSIASVATGLASTRIFRRDRERDRLERDIDLASKLPEHLKHTMDDVIRIEARAIYARDNSMFEARFSWLKSLVLVIYVGIFCYIARQVWYPDSDPLARIPSAAWLSIISFLVGVTIITRMLVNATAHRRQRVLRELGYPSDAEATRQGLVSEMRRWRSEAGAKRKAGD